MRSSSNKAAKAATAGGGTGTVTSGSVRKTIQPPFGARTTGKRTTGKRGGRSR
jgi:hypothetical protein